MAYSVLENIWFFANKLCSWEVKPNGTHYSLLDSVNSFIGIDFCKLFNVQFARILFLKLSVRENYSRGYDRTHQPVLRNQCQ